MTATPNPHAPDLHLVIHGTRRDPVARPGGVSFPLDLPCGDLRLGSRAGRPSVLGLSRDVRLLGYALTGLTLVQGDRRTAIPLDHPALVEGFNALESSGTRWTDGTAVLPAELFAGWHGPAELHVAGFALPHYPATQRPEAALFRRFESLGDDCEFGLVQRHFDAEPPGLFRWAGTDLVRLVLGLCRRFDGLGDLAATTLEWHPGLPEYKLSDPRYLTMHTWRGERIADAAREEEMRLAGCARIRLLRRKLLADIAAGQRIFVFRATPETAPPDSFHALHAALRGIGPAPLLCVTVATTAAAIGTVEPLGDQLYRGHIDRFDRQDVSHDVWRRLCATTAALVDAASAAPPG